MRAVIVNNLAEAQLFGADQRDVQTTIAIPIGSDARYYAESKGWKIRLIKDFFSEESHSKGRDRSEKTIYRVADLINEHFRADRSFPPIPLGNYFLFDLFIIIGQVLFTKQLVEAVLAEYPVRVYENRNLAHKLVLGIRPHPDSLIAQVARGLDNERAEIVPYKADNASDKLPLKRNLRNMVPSSVIDLAYQLRWYKEMLKYPSLWLRRKKKLLVLGGMFDWKPLIYSPAFMAEYAPSFRSLSNYPTNLISVQPVRALSRLIAEAVFPGQPNAFDFTHLAHHIQAAAEHLSQQYRKFDTLAQRHLAVLASVFVTPFQHAVAHCAIERRRPVICYQHGEMNLYADTFSGGFTELANTTHYFAYGEGVISKYKSFIGRKHLKEVAVVGTTRKKPDYRGGSLVVYATGKWFKTARPFLHDPDPDARLYNAQRNIIAYLEEYAKRNPRDKVIVKANNTDLFNHIPFTTNIEINYKDRFTDLLRDAKLVILDTPGTTSLEAASTSVPLFILSGRVPWYEEPMRMLKKRAVVDDRVDHLIAQLEQFERSGIYPADVEAREFADSFGGAPSVPAALQNATYNVSRIVNAS